MNAHQFTARPSNHLVLKPQYNCDDDDDDDDDHNDGKRVECIYSKRDVLMGEGIISVQTFGSMPAQKRERCGSVSGGGVCKSKSIRYYTSQRRGKSMYSNLRRFSEVTVIQMRYLEIP